MKTQRSSYVLRVGAQSRYRKRPIIGPILDDVLAWLRGLGYADGTIYNYLKASGHLVRWLQKRRGHELTRLSEVDFHAAYEYFRRRRVDVATFARSLGRFLVERQLIHAEKRRPLSRSECQIQQFGSYLREMRGLAPATILGHQRRIRLFLRFIRLDQRPSAIGRLNLDQIELFLRQSAKTNNRFSLQHIVASVRAFLRYQYVRGVVRTPLHQRIDTPRTYRLEQLPRALPWEQVTALLRSIDRESPGGLRDFTLLYLAACYGLRSGELIRLTLDDIHWRTATLTVRQTKTKQALLLPLTDEAANVLISYLRAGRSASSHRELFLRRRAPAGPLAPTAVHDILEHRVTLSGLALPRIGSHVLRHSLAVHLMRCEASLPTIGAVLGHRDSESTSIYLRLDTTDLRAVGLPVPNGSRQAALESNSRKPKPRETRSPSKQRFGPKQFHSGLATSIRHYIETKRALGRAYTREENVLLHWDGFLHRQYGRAPIVTPSMFRGWIETISHVKATDRRNRMRIVRNFLLFHSRQHPRTHIPDVMTFPKPVPPKTPRLVSAAEMAKVLATATSLPPSHQNPIRAETIRLALVLLFCCGLRRGELLRMKIKHFDAPNKVLCIEATKFHKSRVVPLTDSVAEEVNRYLAVRRRRRITTGSDAFLFWSHNPIAEEDCYSAQALADNWQILCSAAGVVDEQGKPPRIHDLRHSFAIEALCRWYQQGIDVQSKLVHLATYMGHVSPASTHYYLRLSPDLRQAASQRFNQYASQLFDSGGVQ